ncbi:MAG: NADH-quinone oxidoreductase subunit K [Candidatus Omnitrophica bacterium]|nr:NADH-quinone oxidoreductase subunit K [Candidatus Omnitrophota bacterium]
MNELYWRIFLNFSFFIIMLFIAGFYCILVTRNLIRVMIGLELLIKAVTLFLVVACYVSGQAALGQALIITLIVMEVVMIAVLAGVVLSIYRHNNSLDARRLRELKG